MAFMSSVACCTPSRRDAQAAIVSDFAAGILVLVALEIKIFGFLAVFHDDEADTVALVVFKVSDDIIVGKLELDNLKIFVGGGASSA